MIKDCFFFQCLIAPGSSALINHLLCSWTALTGLPLSCIGLRPPAVASFLLFRFFSTGNNHKQLIQFHYRVFVLFINCFAGNSSMLQSCICAEEKRPRKINTWFVQLQTLTKFKDFSRTKNVHSVYKRFCYFCLHLIFVYNSNSL